MSVERIVTLLRTRSNPFPLLLEAADKLEELAAENEQLKRRLELTQDTDSKMKLLLEQEDQIIQHEAALAEAKRENEALREALQMIANIELSFISECRGIASEALARNAGGKDAKD